MCNIWGLHVGSAFALLATALRFAAGGFRATVGKAASDKLVYACIASSAAEMLQLVSLAGPACTFCL